MIKIVAATQNLVRTVAYAAVAYLPPIALAGAALLRRPRPSNPQFTGVVTLGESSAPGSRVVQLRRRNGDVVDSVVSDPVTGRFEFFGWFPVREDYEFHVLGDGYVSTSFATLAPFEVTWRGNPRIVSSDAQPVPPWAPDALVVWAVPPLRAVLDEPFSYPFRQSNAVGAATWDTIDPLPDGLNLDETTGVLSGAIAAVGTFDFTVRVRDTLGREALAPVNLQADAFTALWQLILEDNPRFLYRHNEAPGSVVMANSVPGGTDGSYTAGAYLGEAPVYPGGDADTTLWAKDTRFGSATGWSPGAMTAFSLECVVNFASLSSYRGLISMHNDQSSWQWRVTSGVVEFIKIAGGIVTLSATGAPLVTGESYHLVVTISSAGVVKIYINGELRLNSTVSPADYGAAGTIQIGWMSGGGGAISDARHAESALYAYALSEEQVLAHYEATGL